jgi:hypothetical protein
MSGTLSARHRGGWATPAPVGGCAQLLGKHRDQRREEVHACIATGQLRDAVLPHTALDMAGTQAAFSAASTPQSAMVTAAVAGELDRQQYLPLPVPACQRASRPKTQLQRRQRHAARRLQLHLLAAAAAAAAAAASECYVPPANPPPLTAAFPTQTAPTASGKLQPCSFHCI